MNQKMLECLQTAMLRELGEAIKQNNPDFDPANCTTESIFENIRYKESVTLYVDGVVFGPDGRQLKKNGKAVENPISTQIYRDGRLKTPKYTSNEDFRYPWALANCDGMIMENGKRKAKE